jgi:hypothetical protein
MSHLFRHSKKVTHPVGHVNFFGSEGVPQHTAAQDAALCRPLLQLFFFICRGIFRD